MEIYLQRWFTSVIKAVAWEQGWYEYGQMLPTAVLAKIILFSPAIFFFLLAINRQYPLLSRAAS